MATFEIGNDPAEHTNQEVVDFLKGDECTPDEYERVMGAEREGRGRVGILNLSGEETPEPEAPDPAEAELLPVDLQPPAEPAPEPEPEPEREKYDDDAPSQLGPDVPETDAEQEAHDASIAALTRAERDKLPADMREGSEPPRAKPYTPAEALAAAVEKAQQWRTRGNTITPDES